MKSTVNYEDCEQGIMVTLHQGEKSQWFFFSYYKPFRYWICNVETMINNASNNPIFEL